MNKIQKNVLQQHRSELTRDLELRPELLDNFIQHGIFNEDMCEEIKCGHTRKAGVQKMLSILPRRGPRAFDKFVEAIQELYPWLADKLKETHHQKTNQYPDAETIALKNEIAISVHEQFGGSKRFSEEDKKKIKESNFKIIKQHLQSSDVPDGHNKRLSIDSTDSADMDEQPTQESLKKMYAILRKQNNKKTDNLPDDISLEMIEDGVSELNNKVDDLQNKVDDLQNKVDDLQNQVKACYNVLGADIDDETLPELLKKRFAEYEKRVAKLQEEIELVENKSKGLDRKFQLKEQQLHDTVNRLADSRLDNEKMELKLKELREQKDRLEHSHQKHLQKQNTLKKMVRDLGPLTRKSPDHTLYDTEPTKLILPPVKDSYDDQADMRVRKSSTRSSQHHSPPRNTQGHSPWK